MEHLNKVLAQSPSIFRNFLLFGEGPRLASMAALEPTTFIKFHRGAIMGFFRSKPERLFTIFSLNILDLQQRRVGALTNAFVRSQKTILEYHSGGQS